MTPDQFWSMAWADFQELLDGRMWWELRKAGVPEEKKPMTAEEIAQDKAALLKAAKARGLIQE